MTNMPISVLIRNRMPVPPTGRPIVIGPPAIEVITGPTASHALTVTRFHAGRRHNLIRVDGATAVLGAVTRAIADGAEAIWIQDRRRVLDRDPNLEWTLVRLGSAIGIPVRAWDRTVPPSTTVVPPYGAVWDSPTAPWRRSSGRRVGRDRQQRRCCDRWDTGH